MDTSDSEYFESADEDFESEPSNQTSLVHIQKSDSSDLSEKVNKLPTLPDINQNKKEIKDCGKVNHEIENPGNKHNLENTENIAKIDDYRINTPVRSELDDKNALVHNVKQISETEVRDDFCGGDMNNDLHSNNENLWNEGEGWGINDESDNKEDRRVQNEVTDVIKNLIDNHKNTNQLKEMPSEVEHVEENMWNNDEWEVWGSGNEEQVPHYNTNIDNSSSSSDQMWKGWGKWGVSSIFSTATQSVSTLTSSVSQGFSTVLETSIGAPDPEELAVLNHNDKSLTIPAETSSNLYGHDNKNVLGFDLSNIGNLVSGVSKLVESTSTKVISGGLDTLETIGKKTMEVIQEGDPGLKRKRAFLNLEPQKPVLSQVLREAKEKMEQENKTLQEKHFSRKVNYESIFDDHQGLVHLEALEMLSKQCDMKLQLLFESSSGNALMEIQETLVQVKELCELPDEEEDEQLSLDELKERLKSAVEEIGVNITYDKLILMWEETESWLNNVNLSICDENEVHQQAVETLAQLTAISVEQFHKAGELLLIKDHHSTADEADSLVQLTTTLTSLIGIVAGKFSDKMNTKAVDNSNKENINSLITNIFFEAANSSSYIQDAFQLLVPVIQMGAV